jgi:hypothetical protein
MRSLIAASLLVSAFACVFPQHAGALGHGCGQPHWRNYDRIDGDADPQQSRRDAEAAAALAGLRPIIFRGRVAWTRVLSRGGPNRHPMSLVAFNDVEVLRGEMPRPAHDRRAFIVYYHWCNGSCELALQRWVRGQSFTLGAHPPDLPVTDGEEKKFIYTGRADAQMYLCDPVLLTPLQWELLHAPADEIARLKRDYPFHGAREEPPE